jgi:G3E family GTPase
MLLSGFLGAGKTTLIGRWLADADFANTAIIVDDPAEAGLDVRLLGGGRTGLVRNAKPQGAAAALEQLARDRDAGLVPPFERVVMEMNGREDPLPILASLEDDAALRDRFPLHGVVAAVDALEAMTQLTTRPTAQAQARAADAFVITKSDLAEPGSTQRVARELGRHNPDAEIVRASGVPGQAGEVWNAAGCAPGRDMRRVRARLHEEAPTEALGSLWVRFPHAVELSGFCVRLAAFLETHAGKVLRVKGFVRVQGRRGPAVIQAVGGTLYPVRTLKEWPAGIGESALVVTAIGLADDEIRMGMADDLPTGRSIPTR